MFHKFNIFWRAYQVAALFGFLTPLTDMYLEGDENLESVEPDIDVVRNSVLTYKDLSPIFYQVNWISKMILESNLKS